MSEKSSNFAGGNEMRHDGMKKQVRIVVPSGRIDEALVLGAKARLEQWGFGVSLGEHALSPVGRFGGSETDRLADMNAALTDEGVDYVLCARGGYGLMQIMDRVVTPTNSATIVGFSDVTALHLWCARLGRPSIHGVMAKHLTEYATHRESCDALRAVLEGQPPHYVLPPHPLNRAGEVQGTLLGGNLSLVYALQGTPWGVDARMRGEQLRGEDGVVLFIEDVGERPYAVDRMIQSLRLSGVLGRLSGLIVGQFSDYEEDPLMGGTVYERIREMVEPYDYPVVFDFPAGHVERNLPLVMNSAVRVKVSSAGAEINCL